MMIRRHADRGMRLAIRRDVEQKFATIFRFISEGKSHHRIKTRSIGAEVARERPERQE